MNQPDPAINAVFSSIRSLLLVLGTTLAGYGLTQSGIYFWVEAIAGSIMIIGPAGWGVYAAVMNVLHQREAAAEGVRAGANLALSGHLITQTTNSGAEIPAPVTTESAAAIIKNYAATPLPKAP